MIDEILQTVTIEKGNIQELKYSKDYSISIYNNSDADIYVSFSNNFAIEGNVSNYITIPSGVAFNKLKLRTPRNAIYIKATGGGNVTVVAEY